MEAELGHFFAITSGGADWNPAVVMNCGVQVVMLVSGVVGVEAAMSAGQVVWRCHLLMILKDHVALTAGLGS